MKVIQEILDEADYFNISGDNESLSGLPLDMQFNDGHRMAIIMYSVLMFAAAVGNIYVLLSIRRLRRKKGRLGRISLLLLNLAIADLVVTFIMMPLEIGWNATVSWHAGDFSCRILSFFRVFGLYLSGFVLACISIDRYLVIMKPFGIMDAESRITKLLMVAWLTSILCSLPQSYIFHVERHPQFQWYQQCITFNSFPSPEYEMAYNLFGFCVMYAIPMTTITYCYVSILLKMYTITKEKRNENILRRSSALFLQRAKTKTLKMAIITSLTFCICWTPYNVICLWYWFDKDSAMKLDQRLQKAFFVFACTNSCFNPLIYGWYHVGGRHQRRNSESSPNQFRHHNVNSLGENRNTVTSCVHQRDRVRLPVQPRKQGIRVIINPCSPSTPHDTVSFSTEKKWKYDINRKPSAADIFDDKITSAIPLVRLKRRSLPAIEVNNFNEHEIAEPSFRKCSLKSCRKVVSKSKSFN